MQDWEFGISFPKTRTLRGGKTVLLLVLKTTRAHSVE
jgi:hypothetical protein